MDRVAEQDDFSAGGPTLTDGVVTLRPWRLEDIAAVAAACKDPLMARMIPTWPVPYTDEHARQWVEERTRDWQGGLEATFAITDAATGRVVGSIARHRSAATDHRAGFGYWLAPDARGRGAATRALCLIVDWTLATTDLRRLELCTIPENEASGRVALRAGFSLEGTRRAWVLDRDGRPVDAVFYVKIP